MKRTLSLVLASVVISIAPAHANDLRDGYKPQHLAPKSVANVCMDLAQTFAELRTAIDTTGSQAAAAGENSVGLGYWSPNKHFRSVEDNFIVVNRVLEPSLDEVTDIPIALDQSPDGDQKRAALELADAYEKSLRQIKDYAHAAVVYERAAHGRRKEQIASLGLYNASQNRNRNDREMTADEARSILDGQSSDVKDASRKLKLPEYRWHHTCGDVVPRRQASGDADSSSSSSVPSATTELKAGASPSPNVSVTPKP